MIEYDPQLAKICREVFGDTLIHYSKPATRLREHLTGYNPAEAPTFTWPDRLKRAREVIREAVRERSEAAQSAAPPPKE